MLFYFLRFLTNHHKALPFSSLWFICQITIASDSRQTNTHLLYEQNSTKAFRLFLRLLKNADNEIRHNKRVYLLANGRYCLFSLTKTSFKQTEPHARIPRTYKSALKFVLTKEKAYQRKEKCVNKREYALKRTRPQTGP